MKCGSNCMYWNIGYYIHQSEIQLVSYDTNSMRIHKIYQVASLLNNFDAAVSIKQSINDMKMKPFSIDSSTT
ncbi:hypothetical protein Avbf_02591 [Armadillidium vulgare]|nr:hypothetical protein Avbf_02591 [Armadillidium vulgare]